MTEQIKFKGYLKVETLDSESRELLDVWEEDNLIMITARKNMAGLLGGIGGSPIKKIAIGTRGNLLSGTPFADILTPKSVDTGFNENRTELFSQEKFVSQVNYITNGSPQNVTVITGNIIQYTGVGTGPNSNGIDGNYYRYIYSDLVIDLDNEDFTNTSRWESLGTDDNGYFYSTSFDPFSADLNGDILADDNNTQINVSVEIDEQLNTYKTTYVYEIPQNIGNDSGSVIYTEAAMFTDWDGSDNIFSMRTFPAKIKDNSVILKITWSIIF